MKPKQDFSLSALRTPSHEERHMAACARARGKDALRGVYWKRADRAYADAVLAAHFGAVALDLRFLRLQLYREADTRLQAHGGFFVHQGYGKRPY